MKSKEYIRLVIPSHLSPECLREEWSVEIHHESKFMIFWDTFEWGLWFGGHVLYSCCEVYHLCTREDGWLGAEYCEERAAGRRRFWRDFENESMRAKLEGMLGLRGLAPVAEGKFRLSKCDVQNELGKIVCRLEWISVYAGKQGEDKLVQYCRVMPLLGYEAEAKNVVQYLTQRGAMTSGDGPLEVLLHHANHVPEMYTLQPSFGLEMNTPFREAFGLILRRILEIAIRNVPGILNDLDTEFLHDYRICLRKMRSLLSLVKGVYPTEGTERMREILGELARQTNRLRDLDVYLLAREEYLLLLPPGLRPALEKMFEDFAAEREKVVRQTTSKMRSPANHRLLREVSEYVSEGNVHEPSPTANLPVGPMIFQSIYKRYRKIRKIAAVFGAETPDDAVHQLRIECKKLRYLMEFFTELIPKGKGAAMLRMLRRLQNHLGEFNDASIQQKSLLSYWEQKKSGAEIALGLGGLVSILYHRQKQTRSLIEQALVGFCGGSTAAAFKHTFKLAASVSATDPARNARR